VGQPEPDIPAGNRRRLPLSPKRNANGGRNPFYEFMREAAPGDLVFSFADTKILAIGVVQSYCFESPKPLEFGSAGQNWENIGWKVNVNFTRLLNQVRPKDHIDLVRKALPARYSPLQQHGNGIQSIYLTEVPENLAAVLGALIGAEFDAIQLGADRETRIPMRAGDDLDLWEQRLEKVVATDQNIPDTDREAIIRARRGQGLFKQRVSQIERMCRITKVDNPAHLVASHLKPWRDSTNEERLNGENGLLLTPSIDHLLDRGFIGFEDSGTLIVSSVAHRPSLRRMGVETELIVRVGDFTEGQRQFLDFHRNSVLLRTST
jgi:putative restriction endonuclease